MIASAVFSQAYSLLGALFQRECAQCEQLDSKKKDDGGGRPLAELYSRNAIASLTF
jgi:hypothetical protein